MNLETLYKQNETGKLLMWKVEVSGNVVISTFGQLGGKLQTTEDTIKGKNQGKSNATTDEEQAKLKAKQLWDKKVKKGYVPDKDQALAKKNNLQAVNPMLAHPIENKEKYVKFPCLVQPKLDGMRCLAVIDEGKATLYTRTQKKITTLPHIVRDLENLFVGVSLILDGELYNHELKEDFNRLMSLIKRDSIHPDCEVVQYHIYDRVSVADYKDRMRDVAALLRYGAPLYPSLRLTHYQICYDREGMMEGYKEFLENGYEGAMYRSYIGPYEHKRSTSLLKIKEMQDAEYKIIDVLEGNGKLQGHAGSFVCELPQGGTFKVKLKGELGGLKEYFENFEKYRGKSLVVQFQTLTPDGVPRFPVGLRIREEE